MNRIFKFLVSTKVSMILMFVFATAMAVATFVENDHGTQVAHNVFYRAWWFELIMFWLCINFIFHIRKYNLLSLRKLPIGLFHLAFILIIIGAGITRYISNEGIMPIREGATAKHYFSSETYVQLSNQNTVVHKKAKLQAYNFTPYKTAINLDNESFKFIVKEYIKSAEEKMIDGKDTYLSFAVALNNGRKDYLIKENESLDLGISSIKFGTKDPNSAVSIYKKDSIWMLSSPKHLHIMNMSDQSMATQEANEDMPLKFRHLYQWEDGALMVKTILSDKSRTFESKAGTEEEDNFFDIILTEVQDSQGNVLSEEPIAITTYQPNWKNFKYKDKNYRYAFGPKVVPLPFSIQLKDFEIERYPGSQSPSSYASNVVVHNQDSTSFPYRIFMNNVLDHKGFRFYQASYDTDEKGTLLSVNQDRIGTVTTYIGYTILFIAMIITLFVRGSRFGILNKRLAKIRKNMTTIILLIFMVNAYGTAVQDSIPNISMHVPPQEKAEEYSRLIVQDLDGRMKPLATLSYEIMRKLTSGTSINVPQENGDLKLSPEQFLLSVQLNPQSWSDVPIFKINKKAKPIFAKINHKVVEKLSFSDFLGEKGSYLLTDEVERVNRLKPAERNEYDKEILKIDERFNIFYAIIIGDFLRIFPNKTDENNTWFTSSQFQMGFDEEDGNFVKNISNIYLSGLQKGIVNGKWEEADEALEYISTFQRMSGEKVYPTENEIEAELFYTKSNLGNYLFAYFIFLGAILLIVAIIQLFKSNKTLNISWLTGTFLAWIGFIIFTIFMGLRWYIAKHPPWTDGFEMMLFVSWSVLIFGLLFSKKSPFTTPLGLLFSGILLFVSFLDWLNPEITNLMPVLHSYWLKIHVAIIVGSYAPLSLSAFIGLFSLFLILFKPKNPTKKWWGSVQELSIVNEMSLTIGLFLLTIGTFLGGVWANESWGRYWAWDPKETWALISIIVYSIVLHLRLIPAMRNAIIFNLSSLWAFSAIIMTSYGVNYYLSGLHSYAAGDPVPVPIWVFWAIGILTLISVLATIRFYKLSLKERKMLR